MSDIAANRICFWTYLICLESVNSWRVGLVKHWVEVEEAGLDAQELVVCQPPVLQVLTDLQL